MSEQNDPFIPTLIKLAYWDEFGMRDFPDIAKAARQVMLQLKIRQDYGHALKGQVVAFDRHDAAHAAVGVDS